MGAGMDLELEGKTALVTGGSRGIGKAIARELATCGCSVVLTARGVEALDLTARELAQETGQQVTGVPYDLTSTEEVERMVQEAANTLDGRIEILVNNAAAPEGLARGPLTSTEEVERMVQEAANTLDGRIEILVNNAAAPEGLARGPLAGIKDEDVLNDLNTKVMGYLRCARAVAPYMVRQNWGRIINIGGTSARRASGNLSAGVRNAGLVNFTKYLAEDLGPSGVTVNIVHPGTTRTERSGPMYQEQA